MIYTDKEDFSIYVITGILQCCHVNTNILAKISNNFFETIWKSTESSLNMGKVSGRLHPVNELTDDNNYLE